MVGRGAVRQCDPRDQRVRRNGVGGMKGDEIKGWLGVPSAYKGSQGVKEDYRLK